MNKLKITLSLVFIAQILSAQAPSSDSGWVLYGVLAVCAVLIVWAMLSLASNLMKIEATKHGIDPEKADMGIFPGLKDIFKPKRPSFAEGGSFTHLTKGHDIKLAGAASGAIQTASVTRYAIKPTDFHGMSPIPKVEVEVGVEVRAGDVLFYDKKRPEIKYVAPVSGEIVDVKRGEKRSIAEIIILADKKISYKQTKAPDTDTADREQLVSYMMDNGLWPLINERPYDVVPLAETIPVNIFISTFDTAPLALDNNLVIKGSEIPFQKGLTVLSRLTSGKVHLGLDARSSEPASGFSKAIGVEKHWFSGPHPAGNVG
ncbi:MAG: NADH:ubiquinone reductase (Na(+)-transporting) subunit A, partial [Saprospiraceae bacterium]